MFRERWNVIRGKLTSVTCVSLAGVSIWRGYDFVDPSGPSLVPPLMCGVLGVVLALTAIAAVRGNSEEGPG